MNFDFVIQKRGDNRFLLGADHLSSVKDKEKAHIGKMHSKGNR